MITTNTDTQWATENISDWVIALAYFSIPVQLLWFLFRFPVPLDRKNKVIIFLFAAFILLCGLTHAWHALLMIVVAHSAGDSSIDHVVEHPNEYATIHAINTLLLWTKVFTAVISIATCFVLMVLIPIVLGHVQYVGDLEEAMRKKLIELSEARGHAELANARKGEFMAFLCHEIRNPLHVITANIDFLMESADPMTVVPQSAPPRPDQNKSMTLHPHQISVHTMASPDHLTGTGGPISGPSSGSTNTQLTSPRSRAAAQSQSQASPLLFNIPGSTPGSTAHSRVGSTLMGIGGTGSMDISNIQSGSMTTPADPLLSSNTGFFAMHSPDDADSTRPSTQQVGQVFSPGTANKRRTWPAADSSYGSMTGGSTSGGDAVGIGGAPNMLSWEQRQYLRSINHAAELMVSICNDVLDIAKLESGVIEFEHVAVDLPLLCETFVNLCRPQAQAKNMLVSLVWDVPPLPSRYVFTDPTRLHQIILQIISNAIKFSCAEVSPQSKRVTPQHSAQHSPAETKDDEHDDSVDDVEKKKALALQAIFHAAGCTPTSISSTQHHQHWPTSTSSSSRSSHAHSHAHHPFPPRLPPDQPAGGGQIQFRVRAYQPSEAELEEVGMKGYRLRSHGEPYASASPEQPHSSGGPISPHTISSISFPRASPKARQLEKHRKTGPSSSGEFEFTTTEELLAQTKDASPFMGYRSIDLVGKSAKAMKTLGISSGNRSSAHHHSSSKLNTLSPPLGSKNMSVPSGSRSIATSELSRAHSSGVDRAGSTTPNASVGSLNMPHVLSFSPRGGSHPVPASPTLLSSTHQPSYGTSATTQYPPASNPLSGKPPKPSTSTPGSSVSSSGHNTDADDDEQDNRRLLVRGNSSASASQSPSSGTHSPSTQPFDGFQASHLIAVDASPSPIANDNDQTDSPQYMWVEFVVCDNGVGMNKQSLQNIFTPYSESKLKTYRAKGGTGLGLCVIKEVVTQLGGEIVATSVEGEGSIFTVRLRFQVAQPSDVMESTTGFAEGSMVGLGPREASASGSIGTIPLSHQVHLHSIHMPSQPSASSSVVGSPVHSAINSASGTCGPNPPPLPFSPPFTLAGPPLQTNNMNDTTAQLLSFEDAQSHQQQDHPSAPSNLPHGLSLLRMSGSSASIGAMSGASPSTQSIFLSSTPTGGTPCASPPSTTSLIGGDVLATSRGSSHHQLMNYPSLTIPSSHAHQQPSVHGSASASSPASSSVSTSPRSSFRILVVDDNEVNRKLLSRMMKSLGYEVDTAEDGAIAVEAVRKNMAAFPPPPPADFYPLKESDEELIRKVWEYEHNRYCLVIMDISMPVMDGYEATIAIRKLGFTTPIIALTANAMTEERSKASEAGMDMFLCKPIRKNELVSLMKHFCGHDVQAHTPAQAHRQISVSPSPPAPAVTGNSSSLPISNAANQGQGSNLSSAASSPNPVLLLSTQPYATSFSLPSSSNHSSATPSPTAPGSPSMYLPPGIRMQRHSAPKGPSTQTKEKPSPRLGGSGPLPPSFQPQGRSVSAIPLHSPPLQADRETSQSSATSSATSSASLSPAIPANLFGGMALPPAHHHTHTSHSTASTHTPLVLSPSAGTMNVRRAAKAAGTGTTTGDVGEGSLESRTGGSVTQSPTAVSRRALLAAQHEKETPSDALMSSPLDVLTGQLSIAKSLSPPPMVAHIPPSPRSGGRPGHGRTRSRGAISVSQDSNGDLMTAIAAQQMAELAAIAQQSMHHHTSDELGIQLEMLKEGDKEHPSPNPPETI